jgi:hypothetical protein
MNHELKALRDQITQIKSKGPKPKFPTTIWDKIEELSATMSLNSICQAIGIDSNHAKSRLKKSSNLQNTSTENYIPKLIQIPSAVVPILEISMPNGAIIKVYPQ